MTNSLWGTKLRQHGRVAAAFASAFLVAMAQGCRPKDCCGPRQDFLSLFVGVRVDSAVFRSRGEFAVELVPVDQTGRPLVADSWSVTATLTSPVAAALPVSAQSVELPDTTLVAAAIDIDDSPSMRWNDPNRLRTSAAQLFWREVLGVEPTNRVALLDFGGTSPSPGFARTRLLQAYTVNQAQLDGQLKEIQPLSGSTYLYHSGVEVVRWTDTTLSSLAHKRYLVIITDGLATDTTQNYKDSLFAVANASQVRIFAVGLGPASDQGAKTQDHAVAVMRELATRTGGIYAGVTDPSQLLPVLQSLAGEPAGPKLLATFRLSPIPARSAVVTGTVTVSGARGTASADWSFVAP